MQEKLSKMSGLGCAGSKMWPCTPLLPLRLKQSVKHSVGENNERIPFVTSALILQGDFIYPV